MKLDFFDTELQVGDEVAFIAPGYRHLAKGTITKFTEKMVFISYMNTWNHAPPGYQCEIKQTSNQLVKTSDGKRGCQND